MCVSAEVDAVAGLVIGAIAVDGLRHVIAQMYEQLAQESEVGGFVVNREYQRSLSAHGSSSSGSVVLVTPPAPSGSTR